MLQAAPLVQPALHVQAAALTPVAAAVRTEEVRMVEAAHTTAAAAHMAARTVVAHTVAAAIADNP